MGAEPVALTNCLNFGNPERTDVYYQLEKCVEGMAAASRALDAPVVSGNVSLYNETRGEAIYPTPIVGALGLFEDVSTHVTPGFEAEGDAIVLVGARGADSATAGSLAGSEYLELVHGLVAGRPALDIDLETAVQRRVPGGRRAAACCAPRTTAPTAASRLPWPSPASSGASAPGSTRP